MSSVKCRKLEAKYEERGNFSKNELDKEGEKDIPKDTRRRGEACKAILIE